MKKVIMETEKGTLTIEMFDKEAPGTVGNFTKLIEEGFYDGLAFHRVIPGFVAQGRFVLAKCVTAWHGNPAITGESDGSAVPPETCQARRGQTGRPPQRRAAAAPSR